MNSLHTTESPLYTHFQNASLNLDKINVDSDEYQLVSTVDLATIDAIHSPSASSKQRVYFWNETFQYCFINSYL